MFFTVFLGTFFSLRTFIITMTVRAEKERIKKQRTMTFSEEENTDLIQRACSDPDAFAQLYLLYYDGVFHYCVRRLFDRHSAEDVTSTVFFKVMHNLSSFDGKVNNFRCWLFRIATNAVNDYLRSAKRRSDAIEKVVTITRAESVLAIDSDEELLARKTILRKALLSLKPKHQAVITLHFFENMKLIEIAACLGINPSTVRSRLSRATAKLRKKLNAAMNSGGLRL